MVKNTSWQDSPEKIDIMFDAFKNYVLIVATALQINASKRLLGGKNHIESTGGMVQAPKFLGYLWLG